MAEEKKPGSALNLLPGMSVMGIGILAIGLALIWWGNLPGRISEFTVLFGVCLIVLDLGAKRSKEAAAKRAALDASAATDSDSTEPADE